MADKNIINIPQDMIVHQSESGGTVLSIRDFMIALGATDEQMQAVADKASTTVDKVSTAITAKVGKPGKIEDSGILEPIK